MDKGKFDAILHIIVAHLTDKISIAENVSEDEAIDMLYATKLYAALENEGTKVWQYSNEMLYELYRAERTNGYLELPEY